MLRQSFEELDPRFARETPDGGFFTLGLNRLHVPWMTMTERVDADATDDIDQGIAVDVSHGASSGFLNGDSCQQSKVFESRSQMFIFSPPKSSTPRPWDGRLDGRLLILRLLNRIFHQAYVCRRNTKRRWSGKLNRIPTKKAVIAFEIA